MQKIPLNGIGEGRDLVGKIISTGPNSEMIPTDKNIYSVEICRPYFAGDDAKHGWTNNISPSPIIWAENIAEPEDEHNLTDDEDLVVHLFSKWGIDSGGTPRLRWYFQRSIGLQWEIHDFIVEVSQNSIRSVIGKYWGNEGVFEDEVQTFIHFTNPINLGKINTIHIYLGISHGILFQLTAYYDLAITISVTNITVSAALVTTDFASGINWGTRPSITSELPVFSGNYKDEGTEYPACSATNNILYQRSSKTSDTTPIYGLRLRISTDFDPSSSLCNYFRLFGQTAQFGRYISF